MFFGVATPHSHACALSCTSREPRRSLTGTGAHAPPTSRDCPFPASSRPQPVPNAGAVAWVAVPPRPPLPELSKRLLTANSAAVFESPHHDAETASAPEAVPPLNGGHQSPDSAPPFPPEALPSREAVARAGLAPVALSASLVNGCGGGVASSSVRQVSGGVACAGACAGGNESVTGGAAEAVTWTVEPVAFWRDMGAFAVALLAILVRLRSRGRTTGDWPFPHSSHMSLLFGPFSPRVRSSPRSEPPLEVEPRSELTRAAVSKPCVRAPSLWIVTSPQALLQHLHPHTQRLPRVASAAPLISCSSLPPTLNISRHPSRHPMPGLRLYRFHRPRSLPLSPPALPALHLRRRRHPAHPTVQLGSNRDAPPPPPHHPFPRLA